MSRIFIDNDAISKLASCNLISDAESLLGASHDSMFILNTLKHRFGLTSAKRRARIERELGVQTLERVAEFQARSKEIPPARDELVLLFEDVTAIDAGEAQMFASASDQADVLVATGDKRSIKALHGTAVCAPIAESLSGRLLCLEQIILRAIAKFGFDYVKQRVVSGVDCDSALRAAFGMGLDAVEQQVKRVLGVYVSELREATGDLLRQDVS